MEYFIIWWICLIFWAVMSKYVFETDKERTLRLVRERYKKNNPQEDDIYYWKGKCYDLEMKINWYKSSEIIRKQNIVTVSKLKDYINKLEEEKNEIEKLVPNDTMKKYLKIKQCNPDI